MEIRNIRIDEKELDSLLRCFNVDTLSLFGSALSGDFTPDSDIDLLVEFRKQNPVSFFDFLELKRRLKKLFQRDVDMVERDSIINPYRREEILTHSVKIYG